ncbi:MAG: hypothetical protein AMS16_00700, partial [Planctomycetes bacterium DG_58]
MPGKNKTIEKQLSEFYDGLVVDDVHFFGIRHHSPACAWHVEKFIRRVRPRSVLIEGPADMTRFVP